MRCRPLTAFCINAKGNHRRAELTVSSLETIVKERDEALKFVTPPSDKTGGPSVTPSTDPGELKLAYAAAAAAAASETDPNEGSRRSLHRLPRRLRLHLIARLYPLSLAPALGPGGAVLPGICVWRNLPYLTLPGKILFSNKLTRAQYLDEVTWTTKSWLGLQKQRISVVLHTAIAEQIVNELACGEGGRVHGAKCLAVLAGVA